MTCTADCPNEANTLFVDKLNSLLDEHIPEQIVKLNKYKYKNIHNTSSLDNTSYSKVNTYSASSE